MKLILKNWVPIMVFIGVLVILYLLIHWSEFSFIHKLSYLAVFVLTLHFIEEERIPGGFGYMFNVLVSKSDVPDRYPMNPFIAMVVDIVIFFILFFPPLLFPNLIWLAMAPMYLCIMEIGSHNGIGFFIQYRKRNMSAYTPGTITATILGIIGITFVTIVLKEHLMTGKEWLWSFLYFVGSLLIGLILPEKGLASKTTKWSFEHKEFLGFYKKYTTLEEVFKNK